MALRNRSSISCLRSGALLVVVMAIVLVLTTSTAEAACSSTNDLLNNCMSYIVGQNPSAPPYSSTCCRLLRSNGASCICSKIPKNAGSLVSKAAIKNLRSSCKLSYTCPGF
ncbi:hypothetical protein KP509_27G063400 [Ceratopteris richardii]|uniref:Bifunctional inhibitor/plant lipid transfer protein/seed storage helical domain-containing protein n=1 Tax=Ceratopteris richardii TaxID=49495 RepID=A0A8T2RJ43_CERRI|nr:hypothetical protein KP509_27G063400 [Ceratopteris richardii]